MKLSRLYANYSHIFSTLDFNSGVNAIVGIVKEEKRAFNDDKKHSHNLGKSTLAQVIDFCFINEHKNSFLLQNDRFKDWEFYLEIYLNSHKPSATPEYITIRRCVNTPSKISFKRHTKPLQNFVGLLDSEWTIANEAKASAINYLDSLLDLYFIKGYSYRRFIGYLLRNQSDFSNVFQLGKNSRSKDKDWKPLLARLLGFDDTLLIQLYEKADELKTATSEIRFLKKINKIDKKGLSEIESQIAFIEAEISSFEETLSELDFANEDKEAIKILVDKIDDEIISLNDELYYLTGKKQRLEESVKPNQIIFDTDAAWALFEEAGVLFRDGQLKHDFDQLKRFNKKINEERIEYLKVDLEKVNQRIDEITRVLKSLNAERASKLSFLNEKDIFDKYKKISKYLDDKRAELILLQQQKVSVDEILDQENKLLDIKRKQEELIQKIQKNLTQNVLNSSESTFIKIRNYFVEIIRYVLGEQAIIKVEQNKNGFLDFDAYFESEGTKNEKGKGSSYRRLLCIAFDMAIARFYSEAKHPSLFIYHDGIFEGLDLNPKNNLIEIIREYSNYGIQHFITLLSYEMTNDNFISETECLLKLNDAEDNSGRLFKMETW